MLRTALGVLAVLPLFCLPAGSAHAFDELDPWIDVHKLPLLAFASIRESTDRALAAEQQIITGRVSGQSITFTVSKPSCAQGSGTYEAVRHIANGPGERNPEELDVRRLPDRVIFEEEVAQTCRTVTVGLREGGDDRYPTVVKATVCGIVTAALTNYLETMKPATRQTNKDDLAALQRRGLDFSTFAMEAKPPSTVWLDVDEIEGFEITRLGFVITGAGQVVVSRQLIVGHVGDGQLALLVDLKPCGRTWREGTLRYGCSLGAIAKVSKSMAGLEQQFNVRGGRARKALQTETNYGATFSYRDGECQGGVVGIDRRAGNYGAVVVANACGAAQAALRDYLTKAELTAAATRVQATQP